MFDFIKKWLGGTNDKEITRLQATVKQINDLEPKFKAMDDKTLRGQTELFRARFEKGETLDQLLPEAYAAVREAAVRALVSVRSIRSCWAQSCCIRAASPK